MVEGETAGRLLASNFSAEVHSLGSVELELADPLGAADSSIARIVLWLLVLPWVVSSSLTAFALLSRTIPRVLFNRKDSVAKRLPSSAWIIHGKKYDLSSWVKDHPGGEWALELGRNRDCTGLFESYHVFADREKLDKILARFEIPSGVEVEVDSSDLGLEFNDAFHEDVKALLKAHFGTGSHKMKTWVGCLMVVLFCIEVYVAYLFLQGSDIALFLLPTIGWILCSNLAHDGSHFAVSDRPWLNKLASCAGMPLFFPSTCWHIQHVVQHHVYTNDEDDVDLYHFLPVCRASKFTKWASQYQLQWLAIFFVLPTTVGHLLIIVPIDLLTRQIDLVTGKRRYSQCQNLDDFVARFRSKILAELVVSVSFWFLSMYMQGPKEGLRRIFMVCSIASFWFIIITQGAHLQRECMVGKEEQYKSWAKRQSATSVNFRPDSYFWLIFTGALNMQSLHHVVPCVGSSQLIDLYPQYKALCAKHGVDLKEVKSLLEFFKGFLGWIKELAQNEDEEEEERSPGAKVKTG